MRLGFAIGCVGSAHANRHRGAFGCVAIRLPLGFGIELCTDEQDGR